jgi:hypothetical protein
MKIDKLGLLSKGWTVAEIEHASKIIEEAENKKHMGIRFLETSIYWVLLFLLIVASVVCSVFLTPFIFALKSQMIIILTALLGFTLGTMFSILIKDIEKIEHKNHKNLIWTMIISGIVNVGLIINFSMEFSIRTGLELNHSPYIISAIYFFAYMIPHIMMIMLRYKKEYTQA